MIITDKNEIVRLKLTHEPHGDVIDFTLCQHLLLRVSIFALVSNYLIFSDPIEKFMAIIQLEAEGKSMNDSSYFNYPIMFSGRQNKVLQKWKKLCQVS